MAYDRPLRATNHCRHYSYERSAEPSLSGPHCAVGIDLNEPGACLPCLPYPEGHQCPRREEYTDVEREIWRKSLQEHTERLVDALGAVPHPIPLRTSGVVECPNCQGRLHYSRWERGAEIGCETEYCCGARFSIAPGVDWPAAHG